MTALPKLPTQFFSHHGPVSVGPFGKDEDETLCGRFTFTKRRIEIADDMDRLAEWITLWHEAGHIALIDGGASYGMTKDQNEVVCDAFASYLTAMMQAGWLKVTIPKTSGKD